MGSGLDALHPVVCNLIRKALLDPHVFEQRKQQAVRAEERGSLCVTRLYRRAKAEEDGREHL